MDARHASDARSARAPAPRRAWATPRGRALGVALALTLCATAWIAAATDEDASGPAAIVVSPKARAGREAEDRRAATTSAVVVAPRASWPEPATDGLRAWGDAPAPSIAAQPPAPASVPTASAPAVAPTCPYRLIGRLDDEQAPVAMFSAPGHALVAHVGETLDAQWRLDAISEDGVTLTWLPGPLAVHLSASSR